MTSCSNVLKTTQLRRLTKKRTRKRKNCQKAGKAIKVILMDWNLTACLIELAHPKGRL